VGFYVTNTQYFIIQQKVAMAGVNISDYMRQLAIYGKVKARWTAEEREIFKRMVSISNDLHQLVAVARQEGASSVLLHFERYRQLIDDVIKRLSDVK
jgi:hypothetical protein